MKKVLLLSILLTSTTVFAQKARNYTDVTDELTAKIIATVPAGKSLHVAVVPFTATSVSVEQGASFGEYITETVIGSLTGKPDKIKVFERTRLDAVLKEQRLILTDLMNPAAALKIGQLVPIDALLSGTYTKLKTYIDVNARLIDVATGEISVSFNGRVKITKNIATLFNSESTVTDNNATVNITFNDPEKVSGKPSPTKTRAEICKQNEEHIRALVNDLSSDDKINTAVAEAKKIPFDKDCGAHIILVYSLSRYKIKNDDYESFLLKALDTVAYPSDDERSVRVVEYFAADDNVDDKEWAVALHTIQKMDTYYIRLFIEKLIAAPKSPDQSIMESRIANYFNLVSAGKIGLPRAISYETAYFFMLDGLKKNLPLREQLYSTYTSKLNTDDRAKSNLFSGLRSMYADESVRKKDVMKWIVDFINNNSYEKAPEHLYDFAIQLTDEKSPDDNIQMLVDGCRDKFSKYALETQYQSQKDDRIEFCVTYNIPVPGVIPTVDEADAILKGNNAAEQQRVMKLLVLMKDPPRKLENSLVGLFDKRSLDDREKLADAQTNAIIMLGNLKTSNTKAIDYMIGVLPHYGNDTEAAEKSLAQIGKPAVNALMSRLDKTTINDGGLQFQLISILGKIGKGAAIAEKSVTRVLNTTGNSDIKYAAEAALQEFKK